MDIPAPRRVRDLVYSTIVTTTYEDGPDDDEDEPVNRPSEIVDTEPGYGWKAGTSMAAPQVAGAVALVRSLRPDASVEAVESLIRETASDAPGGFSAPCPCGIGFGEPLQGTAPPCAFFWP